MERKKNPSSQLLSLLPFLLENRKKLRKRSWKMTSAKKMSDQLKFIPTILLVNY
jgi:hypothetical protein